MIQEETSSSRIASDSGTQIETLDAVRSKLVNAAIFVLTIVGFPVIAASLFRAVDIGWQHVMFLHVGAYLAVLGAAIFHRRLSFHLRAFIVLGGLFLSGIGGLLTWGLIGMGIFFFVACSVLATIFLGTRAGIVMMDMRMPVMDGYTAMRKIRKVESQKSTVEGVLKPEVLAALPTGVLMRLGQATERSDVQLVLNIIEEIRTHNSVLADALAHLANEFDYDKILRLIQEARSV